MAQGSTASIRRRKAVSETANVSGSMAPPVDSFTQKRSWELPTEPYLVELSLTFDGVEGRLQFQSSIEVPSYQAGLGIFRELSAYILTIASRVQSNGE